jgi:photosystem II stability/assembly factor-like uncharacterized protein
LTTGLIITIASATLSGAAPEGRIASPQMTRSLFLDGAAVGDHMLVVGERGRILLSRDAGLSWLEAEVPSHVTLTGVSLYDSTHAWAVGHDAVILRSRDGGYTWERVFAAAEDERPLLDVWFESRQHGFAVGAYGLFMETRDGGTSWQPRDIGAGDQHLNQISAASPQRLYIAAEGGSVYRSDDSGQNWQPLNVPYAGSFFGTLPLDALRVYVYGLRGHLFYSGDAGASWRPVETHSPSLLTNGIPFDSAGAGHGAGHGDGVLFTGMDGLLLAGNDTGGSVKAIQRADRLGIAGALNAGGGALIVYGEFGIDRLSPEQLEPFR